MRYGGRFIFLDGLRGIAAIIVALCHATIFAGIGGQLVRNAPLAVDFFFCLSGFVVAHAYDERLATGMPVIRQFMARRMVRLYPMIFAGIVLGALAQITSSAPIAETALRALEGAALVPMLRGSLAYPLNGPMWSLFFELAACLGYGIAVRVLPRAALWWMVIPLGLLLAVSVILSGHLTHFGVGARGFLGGFLRVAYPFILGVLLQRARIAERLPKVSPWAAVGVLVLVLLLPVPESVMYQLLGAMVLLPAAVVLGAATRPRTTATWEFLGRLSYPLYIVHWPVFSLVSVAIHGRIAPLPSMLLEFAVAGGVAWVALVVYDEPVRRTLGRLLSSKPSLLVGGLIRVHRGARRTQG